MFQKAPENGKRENLPDVDDHVRVGVLGQGLRNDSLSATESTWNGAGSTQHAGEEGVEDTLAGKEGIVGSELLGNGPGLTDGPSLEHGEAAGLSVEFNLEDGLLDGV